MKKLVVGSLILLLGTLGWDDRGLTAQAPVPSAMQRPAVRAAEARIAADAELKRRAMTADLISVQAGDTTAFAQLNRCRVVHSWLLTYRSPTAVVSVHVGAVAGGAPAVRDFTESQPSTRQAVRKALLQWKLDAEEVAARAVKHPRASCTVSSGTFFLRMDTVGSNDVPVWYTPYNIEGRPLAVNANTGQLLDVKQRPGGAFDEFILTPLGSQ